jgi:DNA polymerase III epsilon subunit-like protein
MYTYVGEEDNMNKDDDKKVPTGVLDLCGIDCEMCYTEIGLELTRVTVVCPVRGVVYDALVKPERAIIDYNTAYSGITKETLDAVTTTMKDVHNALKKIISKVYIYISLCMYIQICVHVHTITQNIHSHQYYDSCSFI